MVGRPACPGGSFVRVSSLPPPDRLPSCTALAAVLSVLVCLGAAALAHAGQPPALPAFDRQTVEAELARPAQAEMPEALEARLRRLAEAHARLELAELPQDDRKALSDRIATRMAEVALLLRRRPGAPAEGLRETGAAAGAGFGAGLSRLMEEPSGLFVLVLGGLVVCFALGNLAGYRRGARQASYYGEGDPRMRFIARPHADPRLPAPRVTLEQIRRRLQGGHPVLLQLGYEIEPRQRVRFLAAVSKMQETLRRIPGQSFTAWEDPRHPNRFYECLECRELTALDRLMAIDGPLPQLAAEVEACRPTDGWVVRRAWWGVAEGTRESRPAPPGAVGRGG